MLNDLNQRKANITKKLQLKVDSNTQKELEYNLDTIKQKIKTIEEALERNYWLG